MKNNDKCWAVFLLIAVVSILVSATMCMDLLQHRESHQMRNQIISNQFAIVNNQKLIIENQARIMGRFNVEQSTNPFFAPKE